MTDVSDQRKVVLPVAAAEEVIELIRDTAGNANEDLLDEALEAIEAAGPRVPTPGQEMAAAGEAVAIQLTPEGAEAVALLIREDRETRPTTLRRIGRRLRGKLRRAKRKQFTPEQPTRRSF